ncbi:hypothetical protein [Bacillus solimangrovi]|uniref:Uncharacterized protein n=1 Tax=Bacillus solimangrovi TaxID=1305675 RepID=A0A1E5LJY7_9BACI|nr:hypothetical protein [Bacillus solimangrovi]OEH94413.1 hypothetical protein BFG57_08100 [Bacillus solimangrovi]
MNHTFESYVYLMKNNLIKQMRSYSFLIIIGLSIFIGYACVPSSTAGYEVFYIGGVRGVYNSAWLGGMAAMLTTLLLWLFGFYMLRSQITEDQLLKVGQIIAATPISNFRYISGKAISNFLVLVVIESIMMIAFIIMQLIRGESYQLQLWDYFAPFLFIAIPSLLVLASLTVLFDVLPVLKGVIGNIVFFCFWIFFSVISIASPSSFWDLFGLDAIRSDMVSEAAIQYPFIAQSQEGGSFGYYPTEGQIATFIWQGVEWDSHLLTQRVIWVLIAMILTLLSSMIFSRFKEEKKKLLNKKLALFKSKNNFIVESAEKKGFKLSPVEKSRRIHLSRLIRAELRIMLKGNSIWWYLLVLGMITGSILIPFDKIQSWLPLLMVMPIVIWSQMGTREKTYFTRELILSSCPPIYKFAAVWISGIFITVLMSSGIFVQFLMQGQMTYFYSWLVGVFFIPTLSFALGLLSGSRKLFEVIYMLWWYMGPVNDLPYLDFLGVSTAHNNLYIILTVVFFITALMIQQVQTGSLSLGRTKGINKTDYSKGGYHEKAKQ